MRWCENEDCEYNDGVDACLFEYIGSGRKEDMPCHQGSKEKEGDEDEP